MSERTNALCFGGGGLVGTVKALGHLVGFEHIIRGPGESREVTPGFFDFMEEAGVPLRQLERRVDEVFRVMPGEVRRGERDRVRKHFTVCCGISGGSILAAGLTSGIPLVELVREAICFPVTSAYLRPDVKEYWRSLKNLPGVPWKMALMVLRELGSRPEWPHRFGRLFLPRLEDVSRIVFEFVATFGDVLPRGIFTGEAIEQYVRDLAARHGLHGTFDEVRASGRRLFVITERFNASRTLGGDEPLTSLYFGIPPYDDIPIARAVRASCSIPGITTPLEYYDKQRDQTYLLADGAIGKTIGRRAVLEEVDVDLVVAVNPIVPYDGPLENLLDMLEQTYRKLIHSRLKGVEAYLAPELRARTLHIESRPDMFFYNMLRMDKMRDGLYEGYYQTLLAAHERYEEFAMRLAKGGLGLIDRQALTHVLRHAALVRDREYYGEERRHRRELERKEREAGLAGEAEQRRQWTESGRWKGPEPTRAAFPTPRRIISSLLASRRQNGKDNGNSPGA